MQHRHGFSVGHEVEFVAGAMDGNVPRSAYTVVRQLPNDAEDRDYRVRNRRDGHERVVRESQLRPSTSLWARHTGR